MNMLTEKLTRIGVLITSAVGTMWCAILFALVALVSLPAALSSHDALVIVSWLAQTFLQLVLLPIIIVGQNAQQEQGQQHLDHHEEHARKLDKIIEMLDD